MYGSQKHPEQSDVHVVSYKGHSQKPNTSKFNAYQHTI